jgi:hypothetical protein
MQIELELIMQQLLIPKSNKIQLVYAYFTIHIELLCVKRIGTLTKHEGFHHKQKDNDININCLPSVK